LDVHSVLRQKKTRRCSRRTQRVHKNSLFSDHQASVSTIQVLSVCNSTMNSHRFFSYHINLQELLLISSYSDTKEYNMLEAIACNRMLVRYLTSQKMLQHSSSIQQQQRAAKLQDGAKN
jgi:hypothetical protein